MRLVLVLLAVLGLAACKTTTTTAVDGTVVSQTTGRPTQERDRADRARIRLELASAYFSNGQMATALEEARRAHEMLGEGGVLGKIVLLPNGWRAPLGRREVTMGRRRFVSAPG